MERFDADVDVDRDVGLDASVLADGPSCFFEYAPSSENMMNGGGKRASQHRCNGMISQSHSKYMRRGRSRLCGLILYVVLCLCCKFVFVPRVVLLCSRVPRLLFIVFRRPPAQLLRGLSPPSPSRRVRPQLSPLAFPFRWFLLLVRPPQAPLSPPSRPPRRLRVNLIKQ